MPLARRAAVLKPDVRCMEHIVRRGSARKTLKGREVAMSRGGLMWYPRYQSYRVLNVGVVSPTSI